MIKVSKYIHEDFLGSLEQYQLAQQYWQEQIQSLLSKYGLEAEEWMTTTNAAGEPIWDGNPIAHGLIKGGNKAFRVIQEEPSGIEHAEIGAWMDTISHFLEEEGKVVNEMVISLQLSQETEPAALQLLDTWLNPETSIQNMESIIDQLIDPFFNKEAA